MPKAPRSQTSERVNARKRRPRRYAPAAKPASRAKRPAARAKPKKVAPRRRRFAPADRVFHTVDPTQTATREATTTAIPRRKGQDAIASATGPRTELASEARTTCCNKPVSEVYGVALGKSSLVPKPGDPPVRWCEGVK